MTCEGCANAVKRILGKVEGVTGVDTDVAAKEVSHVAVRPRAASHFNRPPPLAPGSGYGDSRRGG
jgi:hypothetical protein